MAPAAQQGAQDAPQAQDPSPKKIAPKAKQGAKQTKPQQDAAANVREGSKKAQVIDILKRDQGATNQEIQKATGWQAHSIRGFISGNLVKKMRLKVEIVARENGARAYHIA